MGRFGDDKLLSNSNSLERLRELYRKSIQGKEGRGVHLPLVPRVHMLVTSALLEKEKVLRKSTKLSNK